MILIDPSRVELRLAEGLPSKFWVARLCARAIRESFRAVGVPSSAIVAAQHFLGEHQIKISCRIGFPTGMSDPDAKRYETELAIDSGAHEIELVPALAKIEEGDYKAVLREIRDIAEAADERPVKVALEPDRWQPETLREAVQLVLDSGAHYLCCSEEGEVLREVRLLRELVGPQFGIVAPISTLEDGTAMLEAGASRLVIPFRE